MPASVAVRKLEPQPQVAVAFGLKMVDGELSFRVCLRR